MYMKCRIRYVKVAETFSGRNIAISSPSPLARRHVLLFLQRKRKKI